MTVGELFLVAGLSYVVILTLVVRNIYAVRRLEDTLHSVRQMLMTWAVHWGQDPDVVRKELLRLTGIRRKGHPRDH